MEKIVFTNALGQSLTFGRTRPYILQYVDGAGGLEAEIQMQKAPFQDGQTYIDTLVDTRVISLEVAIVGADYQEVYQRRSEMLKIMSPKLGRGELVYYYPGGAKRIVCAVESAPVFPTGGDNKTRGYQKTILTLRCPLPFFTDLVRETIKLEDFVSNFRFPFKFPVYFATRGDFFIINNTGDVPAPISVEFRGPAENPRITNVSTGEYIQVNKTLVAGEKLLINTEFGNKSVRYRDVNGIETNAFGLIDLGSTFFDLELRENEISFISDSGSPEVYVSYRQRYLGV